MTENTAKPARHSGWEIALVDTLSRHQHEPFAYSTADCLIRVSDVALAITGQDPVAEFRGTYSDAKGAAAAMRKAGYTSIEAVLAGTFEEIAPALARRGDCGLIETNVDGRKELAAVIVVGDMVMGAADPGMARGRKKAGTTWAKRARLVKAYRIG